MTVTTKCKEGIGSDGKMCEIHDSKSNKGCLIWANHIEGGKLGDTLRIDVGRCDKGVIRQGKKVMKDE